MTIPQNILFPFGKHPSVRLLHQRFGPSGQLRASEEATRSGGIGSSTRTRKVCGIRTRQPFIRLHVPSITTGCMPTPALFATRKAPSLKRPISPVRVRVPSGNTMTEVPLDRRSTQQLHHPLGAAARSAFDRDIAVHPQHPAEDRHLLHLFFDTHLKLSGSTYISGMSSID